MLYDLFLAKRKLSLEYESINLARRSSADYEVGLLFYRPSDPIAISAVVPPGSYIFPIKSQREYVAKLTIRLLKQ